MAWRGGTLLVAAGILGSAVSVTAAVAVVKPGPPPLPVSPLTSPTPTASALSAQLSSVRPAARPVTLTLSFPSALICGRVSGSIVVVLPRAARVPAEIAPSTVTVNGRSAGTVTVEGSTLTVLVPRPHGLTCMSIVEGTAKVVFTRGARLGNPARSGTYTVSVARGRSVMRTTLKIASA